MPNKHFYLAIGASNGVLVAHLVHRHRDWLRQHWRWFHAFCRRHPDWFLWHPLFSVPFIVWALLPDLLHASGLLPKAVTRGPMFDLFYLHSSFERWEDRYTVLDRVLNVTGSLLLVAIGLGQFVFYVRAWHRRVDAARRGGRRAGRPPSRMG